MSKIIFFFSVSKPSHSSAFFPQTLTFGHCFKNEDTHNVTPGIGWTSSVQVEFCFWIQWGWLSPWGFTPGMEKRNRVRMDIWRTGSEKTSASHAVAGLCPRSLQACQWAVGLAVASRGKSSTLHIRSCHVVLQMAPPWPVLNSDPALLRCESFPCLCWESRTFWTSAEISQELTINRGALGLFPKYQGLFLGMVCVFCFVFSFTYF